MSTEDRTGWFCDPSDEEDRVEGAPWQPFVQIDGGCFPLPIRFQTEAECESWITASLPSLGRRLLRRP